MRWKRSSRWNRLSGVSGPQRPGVGAGVLQDDQLSAGEEIGTTREDNPLAAARICARGSDFVRSGPLSSPGRSSESRAGISTASAEALLDRMNNLDGLCAERDRLKKEQPRPSKEKALGGRRW